MHGLINRSLQNFVWDCHGRETWIETAARAGVMTPDFEPMLNYDDSVTPAVLDAMSVVLDRPRTDIMEDVGMYLVTHPNTENVRRLLRFGGVSFEDFLHSLDDLPDRARMAVADLRLPKIELHVHDHGRFSLICDSPVAGFGHVMMGVLRAMADDYGSLALLEHEGEADGRERVRIQLVEAQFADGRAFDLGKRAS